MKTKRVMAFMGLKIFEIGTFVLVPYYIGGIKFLHKLFGEDGENINMFVQWGTGCVWILLAIMAFMIAGILLFLIYMLILGNWTTAGEIVGDIEKPEEPEEPDDKNITLCCCDIKGEKKKFEWGSYGKWWGWYVHGSGHETRNSVGHAHSIVRKAFEAGREYKGEIK